MNILYLSPVHPLLTPGEPLPRWQTQASHVRALEELGHRVKVVRYAPRKLGPVTVRERVLGNLGMLGIFGSFDAIFFSLGADVLIPMTIRLLLARLRAPLVMLSGVSPIRQGNPRERALAPLATLVAANDPTHVQEWMSLGTRRAVVLPLSAMDPELHYPRATQADRDLDVVFAGTISPDREFFFRQLRRYLPQSLSFVTKHFIWEEEYATLLSRAKIVLNPLRPTMTHGANLRLFEIPAFGSLELSSYSKQEWLIPGKEIVTYETPKDAAEKIIYFLKHERERDRIAKAGQRRVFQEHTFVHRFRKLVELINRLPHELINL